MAVCTVHFHRQVRPKGTTLSPSTTLENNPETADTHHDHAGEAHDHEHVHGPILNPECTRELTIDVPAEEVSKAWRRVTGEYRKYARIPGFRVGKVPESVIRRRFATEIRKEVTETLLPEHFNKAISELNVRPVGQPQVTELTIDEGAPLHAKAVFEFLPGFAIDGYKDVTVPKPAVEITGEEFQHEIDQLRDSHATIEPVEEDRALADGDWAQVSYKGEVDAAPAAGEASEAAAERKPVSAEEVLVEVGGKNTLEAFTSALRGAKLGQELKVEVVYPADYSDTSLAGKSASFDIEVKGIKKRIQPELNDDFAKEVGNYDNYAALEASIREYISNRKRRTVESETKDHLFAALADKFTFPVPESLVQEQIDARLERGLRALAMQGMSPEQMRTLDFAHLRDAQRDSALAEVKTQILLDRIAGEENITVTEEEMDKELQLAALQSRESVDALKERLTKDGGLARLNEQLRRDKTASILYDRLPA
jgi:trigger factor